MHEQEELEEQTQEQRPPEQDTPPAQQEPEDTTAAPEEQGSRDERSLHNPHRGLYDRPHRKGHMPIVDAKKDKPLYDSHGKKTNKKIKYKKVQIQLTTPRLQIGGRTYYYIWGHGRGRGQSAGWVWEKHVKISHAIESRNNKYERTENRWEKRVQRTTRRQPVTVLRVTPADLKHAEEWRIKAPSDRKKPSRAIKAWGRRGDGQLDLVFNVPTHPGGGAVRTTLVEDDKFYALPAQTEQPLLKEQGTALWQFGYARQGKPRKSVYGWVLREVTPTNGEPVKNLKQA